MAKKTRLVPYSKVSPGFEAIYTGEKAEPSENTDEQGNVMQRWSVWTWLSDASQWDEEIKLINRMQEELGRLDEDTRQIRAHIGSLVLCESGVPVTIDELLEAIGGGHLDEEPFYNGCWCCSMWWDSKGSQPGQAESMQTIEDGLREYLSGASPQQLTQRFPRAEGFIRRSSEWLGPVEDLSEIQKLMIERMLLPFEFLAWRNRDYEAVNRSCFEEGGRGRELDAEISRLAGLPEIYPDYTPEFRRSLEEIPEPENQELYRICGAIAHGLHGLSDCHHSAFRWIESWIHGIGIGTLGIPTRKSGTERERLGQLLFGYALALDKWLLGKPMQFLLLDLGHIDLGFDPKDEILRVYAYLGGERTEVKEWLAACLWHNVSHNRLGGLDWHKNLLERAGQMGISVREWMDGELGRFR